MQRHNSYLSQAPHVQRGKISNQTLTLIEAEKQIEELKKKKKVDKKGFEKMSKNMNRFCGNIDACMPLLFGALQVNLNHIQNRF